MKFLVLLALGFAACVYADPAMEMEWKAEYGSYGLNYMSFPPLTSTPSKAKAPVWTFAPCKGRAPAWTFAPCKGRAPTFTASMAPLASDLSKANHPYDNHDSSHNPEHFYETRGYYPENK